MPIEKSGRFRLVSLTVLISLVILGKIHAVDYIEWQPVDGADHYQVVFRKNGEQVFATSSETAQLPVFLPPGDYEFRVDVIDVFGDIAISSEWNKVSIFLSESPFIIACTPEIVFIGSDTLLTARVAGYISRHQKESRFHIENDQGTIVPLKIVGIEKESDDLASWSAVSLTPVRKNFTEGEWSLVMTNSPDDVYRMENALTFGKQRNPQIRRLIPDTLPIGAKYNQITIQISGLENNAEVHFDGPSVLKATLLTKINEKNLVYNLDLTDAAQGWYSATVHNPSGTTNTRRQAFELTPPFGDDEYNVLEIDKRAPTPLAKYPRSLGIGYMMNVPIGASRTYFDTDFLGFKIEYYQNFYNNLLRRIPIIRNMGWGVSFLLSSTKRLQLQIDSASVYQFMLLFGVHYLTSFSFPLNVILHTSVGISYALHSSSDVNRQTDIDYFTLEDMDSIDAVWQIGAGLKLDLSPRFFTILRLNGDATFYSKQVIWMLHPQIEVGFTL